MRSATDTRCSNSARTVAAESAPRLRRDTIPVAARGGALCSRRVPLAQRAGEQPAGQGVNAARCDVRPDAVQQRQRCAQAGAACRVQSAAFVAAGTWLQAAIVAVLLESLQAGPAQLGRLHQRHDLAIDVQDAAALRAGQPLVAGCGQRVDAASLDVERECAHALDGIQHEQAAAPPADLADRGQVPAEPGQEMHIAERGQPGALAGLVQIVQIQPPPAQIQAAEARAAALLQFPPRHVVGGEIAGQPDHDVAVAPIDTVGNDAQPFRSVLGDRDLVRAAAEHGCGLAAQARVILDPPLVAMHAVP